MAKSVGPVAIKVGVNAAGAYSELGKLENRMKRTAQTSRRLSAGGGLSRFAFGVAGALPGGGLISAGAAGPAGVMLALSTAIISQTRAAAAAIDANAKLADRLNISTEALGGLQHAANLTGTSQQSLATGLSFLQRALGQAAMGNAAQIQTLERLGLTYQELSALSPDRQFGLIADRLNQITDVNERSALAAQLFGRGFQNMGNLLRAGSQGIQAMSDEAERLGITFSRESAAKVEAMNDAWTRTRAATQGLVNELTIGLAPALEVLANTITELIQGLRQLPSPSQIGRSFDQLVGRAPDRPGNVAPGGWVNQMLEMDRQSWAEARAQTAAAGRLIEAIARLDANLVQGFQGLQTSLESELAGLRGVSRLDTELSRLETQMQQQFVDPNAGINALVNPLIQMFGGAGFGAGAAAKTNAQLRMQFQLQSSILRNMDAQVRALRNRQTLERDAAQIISQVQTPMESFTQQLGRIQQLQARGLLTGGTASLATASAFQQLADSLPQASATGPEALQAGSVAAQAAINRFNRQGPAVSLQQQIRDIVRRQEELQRRQVEQGREVIRTLQGLGTVAPAGLGGP